MHLTVICIKSKGKLETNILKNIEPILRSINNKKNGKMALKKYYIVKNGEKVGPFTITELQGQEFNKETLVWYNGLENWVKAEIIEELSEVLEQTPPPIPTIAVNTTQNIKIDSPIDININRKSINKEEKSENQRTFVKIFFREIGYIILFFIISILFGFIAYALYSQKNEPQHVSEENQSSFNNELWKRQSENSWSFKYGDIARQYLGESKYDEKITSMSQLEDINATRLSFVKDEAQTVSHYVFYILLSFLLSVKYLSLFFKWLNPDNKENNPVINEIE